MDKPLEERRIVRIGEVCRLTGLAKSTIYKKLAEGSFPARVHLGPRAIGWRTRDVVGWLEDPGRAWNPSDGR